MVNNDPAIPIDQGDRQGREDQAALRLTETRLTLRAPATMEAILDGRARAGPTLAEAMGVFPVVWAAQRRQVPGL